MPAVAAAPRQLISIALRWCRQDNSTCWNGLSEGRRAKRVGGSNALEVADGLQRCLVERSVVGHHTWPRGPAAWRPAPAGRPGTLPLLTSVAASFLDASWIFNSRAAVHTD